MRILLDECTPRILKKRLITWTVSTVQEMGWAGLKNGDLLQAADGRFDIFITTDKNLQYQKRVTGLNFAVLLLPSNQVPIVEKLIPVVESELTKVRAGDFVEIPYPK